MRYVGFELLGIIIGVTAMHFVYVGMTQSQRWQAFCFRHLATAADCANRGYRLSDAPLAHARIAIATLCLTLFALGFMPH